MRYVIVNKSRGARGVNTDEGQKILLPGRQLTAEVADVHVPWLKGSGVSMKPADDQPDPAPAEPVSDGLDDMRPAALKKLAEAERVDLQGSTERDDIIAAIRLDREEKAKAAISLEG